MPRGILNWNGASSARNLAVGIGGAAQAGYHIGGVDQPHELEGERFKRETSNVPTFRIEVRPHVRKGLAKEGLKIGVGQLLNLPDQRSDEVGGQLVGGGHQKGLGAAPGFPGAVFEVSASGLLEWVEY